MSFVSQARANKELFYRIRYKMPGTTYWFSVMVDPPKEKAFRKAMKANAPINLRHFGQIVASGEGEPD